MHGALLPHGASTARRPAHHEVRSPRAARGARLSFSMVPVLGFNLLFAQLSEERLLVPVRFYRRWMFLVACVLFLLFHNAHAALIFDRQP